MAATLSQDTVDPVSDLIHELSSTRWRSDALLRRAVAHAAAIAPEVIATVDKAAAGVYLLPAQSNLLFWGIHILGASKHTALFQPLLRLIRRDREQYLEQLLGDAVTATLPQVLIATFDGNAEQLIEAAADRTADSFVRWSLLETLAQVTFDGRIPRQTTWGFLDRFEREPLADPDDSVWEGWVDAITHLGFSDLFDSVRRVWDAGWIPPDMADRDLVEGRFAEALSLPPGDPTMFIKYGRKPLNDPAETLAWVATEEPRSRYKSEKHRNDPAATISLKDEEIHWLEGFLETDNVPPVAMTMEQIDGFFCALACGPSVPASEFMEIIWNPEADPDWSEGPTFDSAEQTAYVESLLHRHLGSIVRRLERRHPHEVMLAFDVDESPARTWVAGFLRGVAHRAKEWGAHGNPFIQQFLAGLLVLVEDEARLELEGIDRGSRDRIVDALPTNLVRLYEFWRGREDPYPPPVDNRYEGRKVGRNEPCPCGSGKKFKFCCGSPTKESLH